MTHRLLLRSATLLTLTGIASAVLANSIAAQEPRIILNGGGKVAIATYMGVTLSDEALKTLIETHHPEALVNDGEAHQVLLVIDAEGRYVTGKVTKATAVQIAHEAGSGGNHVVVVGGDPTTVTTDTVAGAIVIRRQGSGSGAGAGVGVGSSSGSAITVFQSKSADGDSTGGVFGSGYMMSDVATVGLKRFAAGQYTDMPLIVTLVRLK